MHNNNITNNITNNISNNISNNLNNISNASEVIENINNNISENISNLNILTHELAHELSNDNTKSKSNLKNKAKARALFNKILPYLMVAPAMIILATFVIYPIIYMIYLSFFDWNMLSAKTFVGLDNFKNLFADANFIQVLNNTFSYVILTVVGSISIGLAGALYLRENTRINAFLQSVIFVPHVISLVSISFIWLWLMDSNYGLLNYMLELANLNSIQWLESPNNALKSLVLITVWKSAGYNTLMILSAMKGVPDYLYQAASLDKSSKFTTFFKITLPMISPSMFFLILMNLISAFKVFEPIKIITMGGPLNSTNSIVHMIYEYGFNYYKIGYASAIGVVLMGILGLCTIVYFKALDKKVHYR